MGRFLGWFRRDPPAAETANGTLIGQSLLRLEINTILMDRPMSGEPMPPLPHALLDIAIDYGAVFTRLRVPTPSLSLMLFPECAEPLDEAAMRHRLAPTFDRFGAIRAVALALLAPKAEQPAAGIMAMPAKDLTAEDAALLGRIVQHCEIIQDIIKRLPKDGLLWRQLSLTRQELAQDDPETGRPRRLGPYDISPTQLLRLRKIWDIGTDTIVAQTSITLSGDVVMRVSPMLRLPENQLLLAIHREAMAASTAYWRDLMNTAVTLISTGARFLMGGAKR